MNLLLYCVLWALPKTDLKQIQIGRDGRAEMAAQIQDWKFSASVMDEGLSSVEIHHLKSKAKAQALSVQKDPLQTLSVRIDVDGKQASLDCEIIKR